MLFDDFPELLQHVDSPHVSQPWNQSIYTTGPMRRQRLNRLSLAERHELNRQLLLDLFDLVAANLVLR
jgi:hypothetical protein